MILIDANVLIYAYTESMQQHEAARSWIEGAFSRPDPVGIAWTTLHAFLRVTTNPRLFNPPFSPQQAVEIVDGWLARPNVIVIEPQESYWPVLRRLIVGADVRADLVSDAHLAALAIAHQATICTADRDFERFEGVKLLNPLRS